MHNINIEIVSWNGTTYKIGINDDKYFKDIYAGDSDYFRMLTELYEVYASLIGKELDPDEQCPYPPEKVLELIEAENPDYEAISRVESLLEEQEEVINDFIIDVINENPHYID